MTGQANSLIEKERVCSIRRKCRASPIVRKGHRHWVFRQASLRLITERIAKTTLRGGENTGTSLTIRSWAHIVLLAGVFPKFLLVILISGVPLFPDANNIEMDTQRDCWAAALIAVAQAPSPVKATCYASVDGIKLGPKVEELQKGPNK